jgi:hypothetical protein
MQSGLAGQVLVNVAVGVLRWKDDFSIFSYACRERCAGLPARYVAWSRRRVSPHQGIEKHDAGHGSGEAVDKAAANDLNSIMSDKPIKGPASYFPSIEKTYGRPIAEWKSIVRQHYPAKHMELVAILKEAHGLGHGHANAIVAHTLAEDKA